jgi:hypothetical protein
MLIILLYKPWPEVSAFQPLNRLCSNLCSPVCVSLLFANLPLKPFKSYVTHLDRLCPAPNRLQNSCLRRLLGHTSYMTPLLMSCQNRHDTLIRNRALWLRRGLQGVFLRSTCSPFWFYVSSSSFSKLECFPLYCSHCSTVPIQGSRDKYNRPIRPTDKNKINCRLE